MHPAAKWSLIIFGGFAIIGGIGNLLEDPSVKQARSAEAQQRKAAEAVARTERDQARRESLDEMDAGTACKDFMTRRLVSPGSAKFPWGVKGVSMGDGKYLVSSYVDSQNRFGALVRTNYACLVRREGQNWHLEALSELPH